MKIALIAHDFPPYNVGGSQRPYLMAKSLIEAGIEVTVFTLTKDSYPSAKLNFEINESRLKIIRTNIQPRKHSSFNKGHYFNLTDDVAYRWIPHLRMAISKQDQKCPFDYLFITCPPFSMAAQAQNLSEKVGIPYILDFRDAWSQWILTPFPTYLHYKRLLQVERRAIQKAAFISSTSNQQIKDFITIHGENLKTKFIYVPNGFTKYQERINQKTDRKRITIVYTGSFYFNPYSQSLQSKKWYQKKWYQWLQYLPRQEDWSYRSPLYFFKALEKLISDNHSFSSRIEAVFAGEKPEWFDQMVIDFCLQDYVKHIGFIDKEEVASLLNDADYLLITSSKIPHGHEYSVAGKTFEYIAYRKPILAFVNEGEQKEILKKTGLAHFFNPDEYNKNATKMKSILEKETKININQKACDYFKMPNNYERLILKLLDK